MSMLRRYKMKEEEGFRKLVLSLELSSHEKRRQILQAMLLEDPIYAQYIPHNIITFKYFLDLDPHEIKEVWTTTINAPKNFVFAIHGTADEKHFVEEQLPQDLFHKYNEEREMVKPIAGHQRNTARLNIITSVRKLQDNLRIRDFSWKYPSRQVLKGEHIVIPKQGLFVLYYDDGQIAVKGNYIDKLRSGEWVHYYFNGKVMAEGIYNMEEKDDTWQFYYPSGKLRAKGRYFQNLKEGEWIEIDKDGIENVIHYSKGRPT